MKPFFAGVTGLCLVALAFAGSAKAQEDALHAATYAKLPDKLKPFYRDTMYNFCVSNFVDLLADDDSWGKAKTLKQSCACQVNKTLQSLMKEDCPQIKFIGDEAIRKYFVP
jgi:hypothetical protein